MSYLKNEITKFPDELPQKIKLQQIPNEISQK